MAGRKPLEDRLQVRSERISTLLKPDVYSGLKVLAAAKGISASDLISTLVEAVVAKNSGVIEEFTAAQMKAAAAVDLSINDD